MSIQLTIGFLDGEITDVTTEWMTSETLERHFSVGEVYSLNKEPQGMQWRVLQRGRRIEGVSKTFPSLLPCKAEDVPANVRMVALLRE